MFAHYKHDGFVARLSNRSASRLPFDQTLEKVYNKPAKCTGGIIGVTKRKECLPKYELLKTLREQYTEVLVDWAELWEESHELNTHYEFNERVIQIGVGRVVEFILLRKNPFSLQKQNYVDKFINLASGVHVSAEKVIFLECCISHGDELYKEFKKQRFLEKNERLSLPIPKVRSRLYKEESRTYDIKTESIKFLKLVDVTRERGYKLQVLLPHELVPASLYLFKDGFMRDHTKSDQATEIKKMHNESPLDMIPYCRKLCRTKVTKFFAGDERRKNLSNKILSDKVPYNEMLVIDFMAYAR